MAVEIVTVPCLFDNYAFLIRDAATGATALVDAPEAGPIEAALEVRGWGLSEIWITHHHGDHTDGVAALRAKYGAEVVGNTADRARLPALDREIAPGDWLSLGESAAEVLDVPGHTIGHVAFVMREDRAAFTADSLMALGCGRVNEGTHAQMWQSLAQFREMPEDLRIYSGHNYGVANARFALSVEPENAELLARLDRIKAMDAAGEPIVPSTLAEEKATNPFLRAVEPAVKAALGLDGADHAATFAELRRRKDRF